jgi:hypothetical protein
MRGIARRVIFMIVLLHSSNAFSGTIMLSCGGRQFIEIDTEGSGMKWTDPYNDVRLGHLTMTPDQYSSSFQQSDVSWDWRINRITGRATMDVHRSTTTSFNFRCVKVENPQPKF